MNPFPQPTPLEKQLLKELVDIAGLCYERGWSHGTAGNFSIKGQHDIIWQSPTGFCKGRLNPNEFIPVNLTSAQAITPDNRKPSGEMPVHLAIYKNIPQAKSVVHTHPFHTVTASFGKTALTFEGQEMQKHLRCHSHLEKLEIDVLTNPTPEQMAQLADKLTIKNPQLPFVLFEGHGVYAWGESPMEALSYIEALEYLCRR